MRKIHNWDEWIDYFRYWQDSIGLDRKELRDFHFDVKFGPLEVEGPLPGPAEVEDGPSYSGPADPRYAAQPGGLSG
jgi:hypothetical protein